MDLHRKSARPADLEHKVLELVDFKMSDEGSGTITGLASTFGNFDRAKEAVVKGAFSRRLAAFVRDGFFALNHDWDGQAIGYVLSAEETEKGLEVELAFHSTPRAQEARTCARERKEAGKSVSFSIGYRVLDYEDTAKGRLLKEIELFEVSLVGVPANPKALAARVKNAGDPAPAPAPELAVDTKGIYEDEIAEHLRDPWTLFSFFMSVWWDILYAVRRLPDETDGEALFDEGVEEFRARLRAAFLHRLENLSEDSYYGYLAADLSKLEFKKLISDSLGSGADLEFSAKTRGAGAAVSGLLDGLMVLDEMLVDYEGHFGRQLERRQKDNRGIGAPALKTVRGMAETVREIRAAVDGLAERVDRLAKTATPDEPASTVGPDVLRAMEITLMEAELGAVEPR